MYTSSCSVKRASPCLSNTVNAPHLYMSQREKSSFSCTNEPLKLGLCRLNSGKLKIISLSSQSHRTESREERRGNSVFPRTENSLILATCRKPTSLIEYEEESFKPIGTCTMSTHEHVADCEKSEDVEPPLLFSLERNSYHQTLKTITEAKEAGYVCHSGADKLKDLCRLLHLEDVIWAASKPCRDSTDDIIIRQKFTSKRKKKEWPMAKHDCSSSHHTTSKGDKTLKCSEASNTCDLMENVQTHTTSTCIHKNPLAPSILASQHGNIRAKWDVETVASTSYGGSESVVLHCADGQKRNVRDESQSDGPSKEQLAYMHLRLSEEMPRFFEQSHDYDLYADNIHFDNRIMKISTRGLPAYKATVQSLKYLSTAYLVKTQMEVLRITMETDQKCIQARWRVKGVPFHSYLLRPFGNKHKYRYFDAFSTFYIGSDGLIHTHVLDKVMPSSETKVVAASWAVRLGIMLGLVRPPAFDADAMKAIALMKSLLGK